MNLYKTLHENITEKEESEKKLTVNVYSNSQRVLGYLRKLDFVDNTLLQKPYYLSHFLPMLVKQTT